MGHKWQNSINVMISADGLFDMGADSGAGTSQDGHNLGDKFCI